MNYITCCNEQCEIPLRGFYFAYFHNHLHAALSNFVILHQVILFYSLLFFKAVEHDSTLDNTPSLSLQSLTEEEKVQ